MFRKLFALVLANLFLATVIGTLAGCNTIEGVGKDIQQGGKALKNEANEQRNKM
jgi:predicted small secreted protein